MSSARSVFNSAFRLSEPWTRCILHLSLLCTLIKRMCLGTQVSRYNNHFAMVTLLTPRTSIHLHNSDCRQVWRTLGVALHTTHPRSWARW